MNKMLNKVWRWFAVLYGQRFSLHKKFEQGGAVAIVYFIKGKLSVSVRIEMDGITYFFEGEPKIEEYKNVAGESIRKETRKYGGWEIDMQHPKNRF